jgi:hypothetical protein
MACARSDCRKNECSTLSNSQFLQQRLSLFQIERIEAFGEPAVDRGEKTRQQYNDRKKGRPKAYGPRSKMTLRLLAGIGTVSLREKA